MNHLVDHFKSLFISGNDHEVDDWSELFLFQGLYRIEKNISASAFLKFLNTTEAMKQYLYSDKTRPSLRSGSEGLKLRQQLRQFKENINQPVELIQVLETTESKFDLFRKKEWKTLKSLGVEYIIPNWAEQKVEIITSNDVEGDTQVLTFIKATCTFIDIDNVLIEFSASAPLAGIINNSHVVIAERNDS